MKAEFPALLPPGLHVMPLGSLRKLCVSGARATAHRSAIFSGIVRLHRFLMTAKIPADVWVDGSFLTEKAHPEDCDIVVRLEHTAYSSLSNRQLWAIDLLDAQRDPIKTKLLCDLYIFIDFHLGHKHYNHPTLHLRSYWANWFGCSRRGELKGIAVLRLGETDVGLHLFS